MTHILVTNDDGVFAPGLLALAQALRQLNGVEVSVLAPDRNWSASGHVKTLHRPLRVREVELDDGSRALTSDGAPSDCVALAMLGLLEKPVDLVVSGINAHANLGHDVTYSGTVTAAMEAVISGVPGIAVSLDNPYEEGHRADYRPAAEIARRVVAWVLEHGLPQGVLLNVNVPLGNLEAIKGVKVTRMGLRVYRDRLIKRLDPSGRPYYWIGGEAPTGIPEDGTDIGALAQGYVSVTPLQLDLTAYAAMKALQNLEGLL
jgi:5'-nucleotidase